MSEHQIHLDIPGLSRPIEGAEQQAATAFSVPVEINGLGFTFSGTLPTEPAGFSFEVHTADHNVTYGKVSIDSQETLDGAPAILIKRIGTDHAVPGLTEHYEPARQPGHHSALAQDSKYWEATGVGSFLLDNVCTLADIKGWRTYLDPVSHGGLNDHELCEWYERRGFRFMHRIDRADRAQLRTIDKRAMIRLPREPDISQPVAQLVQEAAS